VFPSLTSEKQMVTHFPYITHSGVYISCLFIRWMQGLWACINTYIYIKFNTRQDVLKVTQRKISIRSYFVTRLQHKVIVLIKILKIQRMFLKDVILLKLYLGKIYKWIKIRWRCMPFGWEHFIFLFYGLLSRHLKIKIKLLILPVILHGCGACSRLNLGKNID
jgi:hypothetical protein